MYALWRFYALTSGFYSSCFPLLFLLTCFFSLFPFILKDNFSMVIRNTVTNITDIFFPTAYFFLISRVFVSTRGWGK